jgi:hypothetical protein
LFRFESVCNPGVPRNAPNSVPKQPLNGTTDPERTVAALRHFAEPASDDEHAISIDACRQLDLGPGRRALFGVAQSVAMTCIWRTASTNSRAASAGHAH